MSLPGVLLFSSYVESLWPPPAPLLDSSDMPTLFLMFTLLLTALALALVTRNQPSLPGPMVLPIIGTKWIFYMRYKMNKLHEAYEDMYRRYGPVFAEWTPFGTSMVSIVDKAALRKVLWATAKRPYRPPTEIVQMYRLSKPEIYASTGLVNEQGEKWFHLRHHLTKELTSPNIMQEFIPELNSICDDFVTLLGKCCRDDCTIRGIDQLTNRMGLESVCGLMLGTRLGFIERYMSGNAAALAQAVKAHFRAQRDSYYGVLSLWKYTPTTLYKEFVDSEETIHRIVTELMEVAKARDHDMAKDTDGMQKIFLKILNNPQLDERDKTAAIIDFITAGIETLANSLVFLLYLLSKRLDWQQRIRSELPAGGQLTMDDLACAPSLRAAAKEAFRMLPTAPFLARVLEEPLSVAGHTLPAGTFVLAQTGVACRQEENFWRAREYLPERWIEGFNQKPHNSYLVCPFGRGRRMCPGKRFVELQLHILLAKILQRFEVHFDGHLDIQFDFLLSPKSPVSMRLLPLWGGQARGGINPPEIVIHPPDE